MVDSDDNNLFCIWNFTIKLSHLLNITIELVFGSTTYVTKPNLFFGCFLDGSRFFKEPAGIVCHAFEAISRGSIFLEFEILRFLPIMVKLFLRVTGFAHLLQMFLRFYPHF